MDELAKAGNAKPIPATPPKVCELPPCPKPIGSLDTHLRQLLPAAGG